MTENKSVLADQDGEFADWIELHNPGPGALDLGGYHLTDEARFAAKWRIPSGVVVPAGGFKIVFASGKDRTNALGELHTNFQLNKGGGYLALVAADGFTALQSFNPYPAQTENVSFGPGRAVETVTLVSSGTFLRALVPTSAPLGLTWNGASEPFDDSAWLGGFSAAGYDTNASLYGALIRLDLQAAMFRANASALVRVPFALPGAPGQLSNLVLRVRYDDGFVAYLNGVEVARRNAPASPEWNSAAVTNRTDSLGLTEEAFDLAAFAPPLVSGTNLLAFHALNSVSNAARFLISPDLDGVKLHHTNVFFLGPTPSASNTDGTLPSLPKVDYSLNSQLFSNPLTLALGNAVPETEIYFTRDGTLPSNRNGARYTNPLALTNSGEIRAVAYLAGWSPSPVSSESYLKVAADLASFTSPLPILVLHNAGAGAVPGVNSRGPNGDGSFVVEVAPQRHALAIVDRDPSGLTRFTNPVAILTRAGLRIRGSSSFSNTKKSYNLETWDALDQEREVSLLGMPAESEWALYGPSWKNPSSGTDYDAALIHNSFIYELANSSGYYAPRTRFVEVFLNTSGGPVALTHYAGLFILTEKVKRDAGRVNFPALSADGATGGWMLSVDRMDSLPPASVAGSINPPHFHTAGPDRILQTADDAARGYKGIRPVLGGGTTTDFNGLDPARDDMPNYYFSFFNFDSPRGWDITTAQRQAITNFMQLFDLALYGSNFTNAASGYAAFIDVENWAHHFILQNFPKNQDAEVLSTYLVRPSPSGKLKHGPIWDFDRGYNQSPQDTNPAHNLEWAKDRLYYLRLFSAPDFQQAYIDKWQSLRRGALADSNLLAIVDRQTNEITSAVPLREGMTNWGTRIGAFKQWLINRGAALDAQFLKPPQFSPEGGAISNGLILALANQNPGGTIFFTLNGTDPRAPGGGVAPTAQAWPQSIVLNATTVSRARVKNGTNWSGLAEAVFYTPQDFSTLALTEIMYHPPAVGATDGDALEFLELKNTGANRLNMSGVRFTDGIVFTFTNGTSLAPGQFFVLAADAAGFAAKYPSLAVGGVFTTGRLNNDGETLTLGTALGTPIFSVTYDDRAPWPVAPDGFGFSLVQKNPGTAAAPNDGAQWRASAKPGGSPGADDPLPAVPLVVINEVLSAPEPPQPDTIELFNASGTTADVSGWFLTDDAAWPTKFRIADGTMLASGGFALFTEADFNRTPGTNLSFSLSAGGEQVYLFSADTNGNLSGYSHGFGFGAAERAVTFGRHLNSVGDERFPAQYSATPSAANTGPRVGPVVLSEILYHPATGGVEFIEIANLTGAPVDFFDPAFPANTWRLNGASFTFPTNFTLPAGGLVVIAGTNGAMFRALYPVPTSVPVLGPFAGVLQNSGERLVLERPAAPATNDAVAFIVVDEVRYNDAAPWPAAADGTGFSLHRLALGEYGDDPANWIAAAPSPGKHLDQDADGLPDWWERTNNLDQFGDDASGDPDGDGSSNLAEFLAGTDPHSPASALHLGVTRSANQVFLSFTAIAGRAYALQWRDELATGSWSNAVGWGAAPDTRLVEWSNTVTGPQRFYRLVVLFPE